MLVKADAVCLVVDPVALVDVAVCVDQPAFSIRFILFPEARILCSVFPDLRSPSFSLIRFLIPLAQIYGSIVKLHRPSIFQLRFVSYMFK